MLHIHMNAGKITCSLSGKVDAQLTNEYDMLCTFPHIVKFIDEKLDKRIAEILSDDDNTLLFNIEIDETWYGAPNVSTTLSVSAN